MRCAWLSLALLSLVLAAAQAQESPLHTLIGLRIQDGWLHLEVEDDGRGLVESNAARTGHGLPNIERRVRHLQGVRRFERPAGGGLRLQVSVPLAFKEGTEDT